MALRLLTLAFLAGAAFAGPYQRDGQNECAKECNPTPNSRFGWKDGTAYHYHFLAENNVTYTGSQSQKSSVESTIEFHVLSQCQIVLKLRNIRIDQKLTSEEKEDLKKKLEIPLPFVGKNQEVEHVCPDPEDSTQSLNIKKAILSSFVNSMTKLDALEETETFDSYGKCKTKYAPTYEGDDLVITIEKDLKSCTNKHTLFAPFIKTQFPSSLMFEDDRSVCKQYIQDRIIKRVECKEKEKMKPPIKDKSSWIEFSSNLRVNFLDKTPVEHFKMNEARPREELLYGLEEIRKGDSNSKDVERILIKICPKNIHVVDIGVSTDFIRLGQLAKGLPYEELYRIYESLKNGELCPSKKVKDLFVDTLPMIDSPAAVKLMVKLIENKEVTGLKAKMWPASFALIQKPTKEMVSAVVPLVKMDCSTPVMLGVSAMIHRVCTAEDCKNVEPVNEIIKVFNEYIGEKCSSDEDDKALSALKAFGNMGYHGKARKNIIACMQDNSKSNRLRLAAIDAFRRMNEKRPNEMIEQYLKTDDDHEIRIAAFASACKHADEEQFQKIKESIIIEKDPQVGSYVSSYIKNMKQTTSPAKKKIKNLVQKFASTSQLPKFKYWENSKHIEMYGFNNALNVGGGIEADVIHAAESKIPRSISTRFDVDIFDNSVNLFEFGIRAEGLEKIIEKIVGLKNLHPKEKSWDLFNPKRLFRDTDAEMSLYMRTLNTEIFDASGSDLTGLGEIIRVAEMMNMLAKGENADFSHSFVFMNSKLVIPSVTGRSYSIDFKGSSSVGITARSKADILSLPRNADVNMHLQPSVNLEVSTTVGIQSNEQKPDIKLVSRLHLESDLETKFNIKDGQAAIASLTMPSENIIVAKLSTDLVNIDENHKEIRVYQQMQKKVDHCFTELHKPLGITACTLVEVPKPLVSKSFPYLLPFGNGEFVLKKSDDSFSSYVMHLEIPKHSGSEMKYKASLDTPGSKIPRQFAVDLDVKQQSGSRRIGMEIKTPFKTAGGSVSFINKKYLIQGEGELHSDSKQLISGRLTCETSSSRTRNLYKISGAISRKNQEPVKINGSLFVGKGRKEHLNVDFTIDNPKTAPLRMKLGVTKEGRLELSSRSEYKLSTEVELYSSHGHMKVRSTLEKKSKQLQAVSVNMGIDYQKIGEKEHKATFSGTLQKRSEKINTIAKFESTQYPEANLNLNWDVQKESKYSIKNHFSVNYGRNPEKNNIILKQESRISPSGRGEHAATVEIPQLSINYSSSVKHNLEIGPNPEFQVDADIRYNKDKYIKGLIDLKYNSEGPLKASGKLEIDCNGRHLYFEDNITEKNDNELVGISKLKYGADKVIQLQYDYKKLSDDSKFHHEIKSSLQTPSLPSPIESKASLKINSESLNFAGHVGSIYSVQAHLNQDVTHVYVKHPVFEGKLKVNGSKSMKNVSLDLTLKTEKQRHIKGSLVIEASENKKGFNLTIVPDFDQRSDSKIIAYSLLEISRKDSGDIYEGSSKLEIPELVYVSLNESGHLSGSDHVFSLEYMEPGFNAIKIQSKRETSKESGTSSIKVSIENVDVVNIQLDTHRENDTNKLTIKGKITSPLYSDANIDVNYSQQVFRSGHSTLIKLLLFFTINENEYKAEWNSNLQPNGIELNAAMQTPHENFEKQALDFTIQRLSTGISSSINIEIPKNKVFSITTEIKKDNRGLTAICKITPPAKTKFFSEKELKGIQIQLIATSNDHKNKMSSNSLNIIVSHDNKKVADMKAVRKYSSQEVEAQIRMKIFDSPSDKLQEINIKYRLTKSSFSATGDIQLTKNNKLSFSSQLKKEDFGISISANISAPYRNFDTKINILLENQSSERSLMCYIDVNGKREGEAKLSITSSSQNLEMKGGLRTTNIPEISANAKWENTRESLRIFVDIVKSKSTLFSTSFNRISHADGDKILMKTHSLAKNILDVEVSRESRDNLKKISLKVGGDFPTLSVAVSKNYVDPTSVSTELRVCRENHQMECYSLKSYHKNMINSHNYRFYQKLTMDLEKSLGGSSNIEAVGSLQVITNQNEYDSESKVIFKHKDRKLGCELKFHKRQHQDDHHSFDAKFFLPQCASRFSAVVVHNDRRMKLELDAIPNTEDPTHKFRVVANKDINPETKEVSGYIKLDHPTRSEPFLFTCKIEQADETFVKGKMLLHYSTTYGKTLTFEFDPDLDKESEGIRSMAYKLYSEDKSLDAQLKLIKQQSSGEDKIGYEWKYNSEGIEKLGGVMATLYDKKAGKPKSAKIKYYSSSADYEVQGSIAQAPEEASLSLVSGGLKLKELRIKTTDSCLNIELNHSGPLVRSSLCVNKQEGDIVNLVKVDIYCLQRQCVDARLYLDSHKPGYVSGALKWEKQDLLESLGQLTHYDSYQGFPFTNIIRELKEKLNDITLKIRDTLRNGIKRIKEIEEEISWKVRRIHEWNSEVFDAHLKFFPRIARSIFKFIVDLIPIEYFSQQVIKPLHDATVCFFHAYLKLVVDHIPQMYNIIMEVTKAQFEHCLKKFCVEGTFCRDFFLNQQNGMQTAQDLFYKRISEAKDYFRRNVPSMSFPGFIDLVNLGITRAKIELENKFGKSIGDKLRVKIGEYVKKQEKIVREICINALKIALDNLFDKINRFFDKDEDYRIVKSLAADVKMKVTDVWRSKEEIANETYQAMQQNIEQNAKRIIQDRIQVQKFAPKEGVIQFSFRQPLGRVEAQILKNELRSINRKLVEYLKN